MEPEVVNRNKNCVFNGPYAGRDLYITMYQDNEREFVVTHNANIKPVAYFTGRETELQDIRQRIEEGRKSVLVSGMGGIGKTHICRKLFEEYLNKHAENEGGPFRHIGYIEYNGDMGSSLQNCLKFKQQDNPEQNQEAVWRELEYLAADGKLLLFVDNVDKSISADTGLQKLKEIPGAIVLTSRQVSFGDEFEPYRIGFLGMEQCKEIYEKIRYRECCRKVDLEEVPDLEYVIEALVGRHTITIEFLAHLARTKLWTVKRLREELEQKGFRLEFHKDGEFVNIQESYEALYDLSELTEEEQNILEAFSIFPYIPLEAEICNQWLLADAGASEDDDILIGLYQKGWLQFYMEQESYSMHPVFAQFIYEKCRPKLGKHLGLVEACKESLKIPESGSVLECKKYISFSENIAQKVITEKGIEQAEFILVLANLLQAMAEYKKAEQWYKDCVVIGENVWGENHPNTLDCYTNLVKVNIHLGKYGTAEEYHEACTRISNNMLAVCLGIKKGDEIGDYEDYLKKNLQFMKGIVGEEHPDIVNIYLAIADLFVRRGEYGKAEELSKKSLAINKKVLGENHPDTASCYASLAECYKKQSEYKKAEEVYERALLIYKNVLGENHLSTARSYGDLAECYKGQGKYNKAEELYEKGLAINKKVLGENHPDTASCYANLAECCKEQKKSERALRLYEKSLAILESVFDDGNLSMVNICVNLNMLYIMTGEYDQMEEIYKKILQIESFFKFILQDVEDKHKSIIGEPIVDLKAIQEMRELHKDLLKEAPRIKEVKEKLKKVLQSMEKDLGENHPDVARCYSKAASFYEEYGWLRNSLEFYLRAYKIFVFRYGLYHMDTQAVCINMKRVYSQWNAESYFEQWLEEQMKEPEHN